MWHCKVLAAETSSTSVSAAVIISVSVVQTAQQMCQVIDGPVTCRTSCLVDQSPVGPAAWWTTETGKEKNLLSLQSSILYVDRQRTLHMWSTSSSFGMKLIWVTAKFLSTSKVPFSSTAHILLFLLKFGTFIIQWIGSSKLTCIHQFLSPTDNPHLRDSSEMAKNT